MVKFPACLFIICLIMFLPGLTSDHRCAHSDSLCISAGICAAQTIIEKPLPHNRYSTTLYFSQVFGKKTVPDDRVQAENNDLLHEKLFSAFYAKFESGAYQNWSKLPGIPREIQRFPEEAAIKALRAAIAEKSRPADGMQMILIPQFSDLRFTIDGKLDEPEWETMTAKIMTGINGRRNLLYLVSDGSELFIGCDAIDEVTQTGFDQFRFYLHPCTTPLIVNERIHVDSNLTAIRQTRLKWRKEPPSDDSERWKTYPISDWNIYGLASGTSFFSRHKTYEASINLKESGIAAGVPFAAFVEIETDPVYEGKKFKNRVHSGELGSQQYPVWFQIQKIPAESLEKPAILDTFSD